MSAPPLVSPPPAASSAPAASAPSPAPRVFEGCTAISLAGHGWKYECANLAASIGDHPDKDDALLEGAVTMLRASLPGNVEVQRGEGTFGGMRARTVHMTAKDGNGSPIAISDQRFFARPEGARLVICTARADLEARCQRILEELSQATWQPPIGDGATARTLPAAIAGRPVETPQDCKVLIQQDNAGGFDCPDTLLTWLELPPSNADATEKRFVDNMMKRDPDFKESPMPCALEGVSTTCRRFSSPAGTAFLAHATVRGKNIFAACMASHATKLPNVCMPIFRAK